MSRACLVFAFAIASIIAFPSQAPAQPNSEKASQVPGRPPEPPPPPKAVKDSVKAARAKSKHKAMADTTRASAPAAGAAASAPSPSGAPSAAPANAPAGSAAPAAAPSSADSVKASVPAAPAPSSSAAPSAPVGTPAPAATAAPDSAQARVGADSAKPPEEMLEAKVEPKRAPQDLTLFKDPPLLGREYGFGVLGSVVAGTLCFYIGSGIETAIVGERRAHKGTLAFTGIRYDNFKGAFWGGSTGMILGSALTTYFTGQLDEEDGGFFATLAGTTAAAAGAFYLASLMGVNDDIDWKPFIPLLVVPSLGGTLGFNLSRWFHDHEREEVVGKEAAVRLHAPGLAWGIGPGGERVELKALRLTF